MSFMFQCVVKSKVSALKCPHGSCCSCSACSRNHMFAFEYKPPEPSAAWTLAGMWTTWTGGLVETEFHNGVIGMISSLAVSVGTLHCSDRGSG